MSITNTIFYSWQSDLPANHNRTFIENCLKKALKNVSGIGRFNIELNLDRDTMGRTGTPSIIDSIFEKIDQAKLFVADISIINSDSSDRKMPNPNVLIELGYAAKSLGWERIICIYNTDFGTYDDLPFDLRQRRPLSYNLAGKTKVEAQKQVIDIIADNIRRMSQSGLLYDNVSDFLKMQVDTEVLTIVGHFRKLLYGYHSDRTSANDSAFFKISDEQFRTLLSSGEFLGFQIFKKLSMQGEILIRLVHQTLASPYYAKSIAAIIIEYVKWIGRFDKFNSVRTQTTVFSQLNRSEDSDYRAIRGTDINPDNRSLPNRFILFRKIDDHSGQVVDFGDFLESLKIQKLLNYFRIASENLDGYVALLRDFINISERWLNATNGEFIVDNIQMFELKRTPPAAQ